MVSAMEAVLDGRPAPSPQPQAPPPEHYVWNYARNSATDRIADLLLEGLPRPSSHDVAYLRRRAARSGGAEIQIRGLRSQTMLR